MYDPTNGETPLADLPQWTADRNNYQQNAKFYAASKFRELFGRNPTASELSMLSSSYDAGNNIDLNLSAGDSTVAQYFNSIANSPENQEKQKREGYEAAAPKYFDEVNSFFQSTLGRDATDAEKKHFGSQRASGLVDSYTLGEWLKALPEAVQQQDKKFREGLNTDLQKQDSQYYSEQIMPSIQAQATRQGRSLDSSGVTNSLALAGQQQNRQRESFLASLSASQYGNSQGLAQDAYKNAYGSYQGLQDYSRQRRDYMSDAFQGRVNSINDFNMQRQAYDSYLRRYGKRNYDWMDYANLGLNAVKTGASAYGAAAGAGA